MAGAPKLDHLDRFAGLSDADVKKIVSSGTYLTVPAGWALAAEHTPADKAYIVISGDVSVRHGTEEIARLGAGDVMGEVAIVGQRLRTATLVSVTPLEVLHFTRENFEKLITELPDFKKAIEATSAERLQRDESR